MATAQTDTVIPLGAILPRTPTPTSRNSPHSSPRLSHWSSSPLKIGRRSHSSRVAAPSESSTSSTPYYHSFKEGRWLGKLLAELTTKDSEIANLLRLNQGQHISKVLLQQLEQKQELINTYREFLESLVSLVVQSMFLKSPDLVSGGHDPQGVVQALVEKKCPSVTIFRRLVIEPSLAASTTPDSVSAQRYNGVPVNQLARFCDIAVLRFLSGANEHTKPYAVLWAIDYISGLLYCLISSIANHSSVGWYGAPCTRQKKTVSVNIPPPFLQSTPPTVVVVGVTSPPPLDPETGQPRIHSGASGFHFPPHSHISGDEDPRLSPHSSSDSHRSDAVGGERRLSPFDLNISPTWSGNSSPMLSPQHPWGGVGEGAPSDGGGVISFRPRSPRLTELKLSQPSIPEEEEEDGERPQLEATNGNDTKSETDNISEPRNSESEEADEDKEKENDGEEEVKCKQGAPVNTVPEVDIRAELKLYITAEGRISLIAILQALAHLPQSDMIWTERLGMNCFQLIQHCMDLGLSAAAKAEKSSSATSSSSLKRQRFQKQQNSAFLAHGKERPCQVYSRHVVHYAVHALIQCATNLLIGCSHDTHRTCWLAYKRLGSQNSLIHPRLVRQLNRIHCHSPQQFQRVMLHFAAAAPLRKVLHFLHVVLEYCQVTSAEKVDSLLLSIVSSVLRPLVDRLAQLDLSKPSLQGSLVSDVCLFIQYAQKIFNFHPQLGSYRHFHMYIHRVALSVVLPHQEPKNDPGTEFIFQPFPAIQEEPDNEPLGDSLPSQGLAGRGTVGTRSLPRKMYRKVVEEKRSSIQSDHIILSKSPKQKRGVFTKQHSIHERDESTLQPEAGGMEEWRRLKLKVLQQRIQRLVVLMELSEPGTIPDAGMLSSLIDLSDGTQVVARAMVLLECALFVKKLRNRDASVTSRWLRNKPDAHQRIGVHLKKWATAIGEKLRIVELRERDKIQQLLRKGRGRAHSIVLPEEPVLPDSPAEQERQNERGGKSFQTVSFGIKMCACVLLYEITHYLRDNAATTTYNLSTPRVSVTNITYGRRQSVNSTTSTDTDAVMTPTPGPMGLTSLDSKLLQGRHRLTPEIRSSSYEEDALHSIRTPSVDGGSFEDEQSESPQKRVSVYLRVDSANEKQRGRVNSGAKRNINVTESKTSGAKLTAPPKRRSSLSVSVGRRHVSFYEKRSPESPVRSPHAAAATINTLRPLPGKTSIKPSHSFQETSPDPISPSGSLRRPKLQSQSSNASQKNIGAQIQSGITRLARRAFRGKIQRKSTQRKSSVAGNSPNLIQRKRPQRLSMAGLQTRIEDDQEQFPWLEIVEHLVVIDALNPDAHARHSRACLELVTALNHVYGLQDSSTEKGSQHLNELNLNSLFSATLDPFLQRRGRDGLDGRGTNLRRTGLKYKQVRSVSASAISSSRSTASSVSSSMSMASLDFSQIQRSIFWTPSSGQATAIELFLEHDSGCPLNELDKNFNHDRRNYMQQSFAGLTHAPMSLMVYTAPLLSSSSFSSLKDVAWGLILDRNKELANAAGMFFLLAAAKEGESDMKEFFAKKLSDVGPYDQREAVARFIVLWKVRYKVWPAIGERGQKKFNSERVAEEKQDQQTIGYSLPTNLLGSAGRDVPVPPWKALSLCGHNDCHINPDKCYRATRLAPLKHCKEVSEAVESFSISGISISLEADSKPTSVFAGVGSEDNAGNISINQWEAVEPTLFPPSLLPLISFVITSLTPSHSGLSSSQSHTSLSFPLPLNRSELAYQAIKQCMVEDPRLLFRPLLNRFNRLYQEISDKANRCPQTAFINSLKEVLHPFHVILQSFPSLPQKASHFLFNSFIGIITRHTDQPCTFSSEIMQSVLLLLAMVIPSVKGLDLKALKSMLKKESCYTTILTTARIRGTEKISIIDETAGPRSFVHDQSIGQDDTFGQVIAELKGTHLSYDLLQNLYLVDQNKDLPVLSMLVVKDHYSMRADKQYPTFVLREAQRGSGREVWSWGDQMNQLFVHKMSEVLRVMMIFKLLWTGPDVERGSVDVYNKFAQPNYQFLHQELVALTSFPRQALTSILYEAGPASLSHHHLRSSDSMLMGTWVKFVLGLFTQAKPDHDWENSISLFLNVLNGALLLYSEDLSILRQALAALIVVASKFVNVFRRHGYEMVTPALIQVYASHINNKVITSALKFVWGQFYMLNLESNVFVLQAIAATATLLSEEAAKLSSGGTSLRLSVAQNLSQTVVQNNNAKAAFQLLQSLASDTAPQDDLHIMSDCPMEQRMLEIHWQPLTLQTTFYLCITIASWNPEAVRGMQVLVFMNHLMPMFLSSMSLHKTSSFVLESMKSLVKGCDTITKPHAWKGGDFLTGRRETQRADTQRNLDLEEGEDDGDNIQRLPRQQAHPAPSRKPSTVAKIYRMIVNPGKSQDVSEGSAYFTQSNLDKAISAIQPMGHSEYVGGFKRRLQATNQRVLQLSRESLLSLSSKMVMHESALLREKTGTTTGRALVRLDTQTLSYLTAIAVQLLKLGGSNEDTLTSQGLCSFMESLLPNIEWTDTHFSSFHNIVNRLVKLFRALSRVRILLAWDSLALFLKGITQCIKTCDRLAAQEQVFVKLKMLLDIIMSAPVGGGGGGGSQEGSPGQGNNVGRRRPLLHYAPASFNEATVRLISQLVVTTKDAPNPRLQYHIADVLTRKLVIKDSVFPKILLPLCIHLGLREDLVKLPEQDLQFLLALLDNKVENILKLSRPPLHPSHFMDPSRSEITADMFCRAIKVFCCAFSNSFKLKDWSQVAHWIIPLSLRRLEGLHQVPQSRTASKIGESVPSVATSSNKRSSRHSSVSGQCTSDSYLAFYKALLTHVYEGLLHVHHIPLFSFLWPLLEQIEAQLSEAESSVKIENPAQLQDFRNYIEKCRTLRRHGPAHTTRSKDDLLRSYQDELKSPSPLRKFKRSSTINEHNRPPKHHRRKLSYQHSLPSIGEEELSGHRTKIAERRKHVDARPTFLKFSGPSPDERGKKVAVVMKGVDFKKQRSSRGSAGDIHSISSMDNISSQKKSLQTSNLHSKRIVSKKYTASQVSPLSPLSSPTIEASPRRVRKTKKSVTAASKPAKNPPLSKLKNDSKFTSSEFQADVEDFDTISPNTPTAEGKSHLVTANEPALKFATTNTVTVEAEVHLETMVKPKHITKESSVTSTSSLVLQPPPPSPRPSSRSASPLSSPCITVNPISFLTPSPPPNTHSLSSTSTQSRIAASDPIVQGDGSYPNDCSSELLIPRNRSSSSPPPLSRNSPRESSPCDTETDTDTLLPLQPRTGGSLQRALSPSSSFQKKLSFVKQNSDKSKAGSSGGGGGTVFLNSPSLGEDSEC